MIESASAATARSCESAYSVPVSFSRACAAYACSRARGYEQADQGTDNNHTRKRDEVFGIGHPECQVRRDKEEIKGKNTDNGSKDCRAESSPERDDNNREQDRAWRDLSGI